MSNISKKLLYLPKYVHKILTDYKNLSENYYTYLNMYIKF